MRRGKVNKHVAYRLQKRGGLLGTVDCVLYSPAFVTRAVRVDRIGSVTLAVFESVCNTGPLSGSGVTGDGQ